MDHFTRVSPAIDVDVSVGGHRVVALLERFKPFQGRPKVITVDNDPEFARRALDAWAHENGVKLDFTRPGRPINKPLPEVKGPPSLAGRIYGYQLRRWNPYPR